MACAKVERTFGSVLSGITASRHLKLVSVPSICPFTLNSLWVPSTLFVIKFVFAALITILYLVKVLFRLSIRALVPALPQLQRLCHRQSTDK